MFSPSSRRHKPLQAPPIGDIIHNSAQRLVSRECNLLSVHAENYRRVLPLPPPPTRYIGFVVLQIGEQTLLRHHQ